MNRPCSKAIRCSEDNPLQGFSSLTINPPVPATSGIVFGDPTTGIVLGDPDVDPQIALGRPFPSCPAMRCDWDDFLNFSSECDDVDYLQPHKLICQCIGDTTDIFIRSPGIGPFKWFVSDLPPGLNFLVDHPCTGILNIFGAITTPGRYFVNISVTDGFGGTVSGDLQFNVLQILTTTLPPVTIGTPYSQQLDAVGGSGNYAWKIFSGALAPGLVLTSNGHIGGTPTAEFPPQVTIECIDTECETPDSTFFPPYVLLTGSSMTTTAKIIGFPGFTNLVPPKAYRTVSWAGQVTNGNAHSGDWLLGYCGFTQIDLNGNPTSARIEEGYFKAHGGGAPINLNGPCLFGPVIASSLISANFGVMPGAFFNGPSLANRDTVYGLVGEAGYNHVTSDTQAEKNTFGSIGSTIFNVNRTVVLSDEYTDADALSVATLQIGVGLVAASFPRTTGYISTWTTVTFTLACHNLMAGQAYVATVDFLSSTGGVTTISYPFTASGVDNTITDSIPVPADGQWTLALNPTITLA